MTAPTEAGTVPRRRGRRGRKRKTCLREGCTGRRVERGYCTVLCRKLDEELATIQRLTELLGDAPLLAQWWVETVTLGDSWSRRLEITRELGELAHAAGIAEEQWQAIRAG